MKRSCPRTQKLNSSISDRLNPPATNLKLSGNVQITSICLDEHYDKMLTHMLQNVQLITDCYLLNIFPHSNTISHTFNIISVHCKWCRFPLNQKFVTLFDIYGDNFKLPYRLPEYSNHFLLQVPTQKVTELCMCLWLLTDQVLVKAS